MAPVSIITKVFFLFMVDVTFQNWTKGNIVGSSETKRVRCMELFAYTIYVYVYVAQRQGLLQRWLSVDSEGGIAG